MSHPTSWPSDTSFYPIGNTPPICLTDHLPPEVDAKILLLGCGDPRNILYTVNVDHGAPDSGIENRLMDITCCDSEPAIIARNVLLFTFIMDSVEPKRINQYWSIFYDIFFDQKTASLLNEQCLKLVNYATDVATWNSSPYGHLLRFTTEGSLNGARRHWRLYIETLGLSNPEQNQLKQVFLSQMKKMSAQLPSLDVSSIYAAAPSSFQFPWDLKMYTQYWKTGITVSDIDLRSMTQINPTFLFSIAGRRFNLHFGTDLCSSFHLSLALARAIFGDMVASMPATTEREVWAACRTQFSMWSTTFHKSTKAPAPQTKVIIRFVAGDALAFCDALRLWRIGNSTPSVYTSTWGVSKYSFYDESMPTSFNVIDSSNLSDHLGLVNILVAAIPILQKGPHTILNTNSLLSYKNHPTQRSDIEARALLDFPSLALFLGVTPVCHSSGLTFRNGCESAIFSMVVSATVGRYYERCSWRFSDFTHARWDGSFTQRRHRLRFAPAELAHKLLSLYLNMFQNENVALSNPFQAGGANLTKFKSPHYHRRSFVQFLNIVRTSDHLDVDWSETLSRFVTRITANNSLIVGSNNLPNLFTDLHMWGIHSEECFASGFIMARYGSRPAPFQAWDNIPPVVCVVLKVPRSALKVLKELQEDQTGGPILECETYSKFHKIYSSIRPTFGDIINASGLPGQKVIVEDPQGLNGNSPLVISFYVPAWVLAEDPDNLQVGLCLKNTFEHSRAFVPKLGPSLRLFSTKLSNRGHVFIFPERPDNPGELERFTTVNALPSQDNDVPALGTTVISLNSQTGLATLSKRFDATVVAVKDALTNKAVVETKQTAPSCIEITIGDHRYPLYYPIPVDGSRTKTRIARKSSYIEIEAPARISPLTQLMLQPFPMTLTSDDGNTAQATCWNAPYVNLDALPTIPSSGDSKWVKTHIRISLSRAERGQSLAAPPENWGPLMRFKMSISNILNRFVESQARICLLQDTSLSKPKPHAILLLSSIRFDLSSGTVIGDAAVVVPTSPSAMSTLDGHLSGTTVVKINTNDEEVRLWKHALPAFADRCRKWQHLPTCEYHQHETIPLSIEYNSTPLCSCGVGKNLGPFLKNNNWRGIVPYATRIALSPVFPVTYLEDVTEGSSETTSQSNVVHTSDCSRCGSSGKPKLLQCSACQVVKYCSKDCQRADWGTHKHICKTLGKRST
ncbi:hypothetical protein P691DRAFT_704001 [Macrolepiota fuliginosa MF-IS2]|uniref:MYND-type domain-containing protein n=1 Tax=Macrolepiota fuliginosa MF-IS2 TaxID=1400762 RepID=A0A9P6C1Y6_9AGAR|nr:hypothetical protein P691DRAFT_704001 [Macrolepiota fuliginosa MF-IS2]